MLSPRRRHRPAARRWRWSGSLVRSSHASLQDLVVVEFRAALALALQHTRQRQNKGVEWTMLTNGIECVLYHVIYKKPIDKDPEAPERGVPERFYALSREQRAGPGSGRVRTDRRGRWPLVGCEERTRPARRTRAKCPLSRAVGDPAATQGKRLGGDQC